MYKPLGHSKNRNNPRVYRKGLEKETIVHPHNGVGGGRGEGERGGRGGGGEGEGV